MQLTRVWCNIPLSSKSFGGWVEQVEHGGRQKISRRIPGSVFLGPSLSLHPLFVLAYNPPMTGLLTHNKCNDKLFNELEPAHPGKHLGLEAFEVDSGQTVG